MEVAVFKVVFFVVERGLEQFCETKTHFLGLLHFLELVLELVGLIIVLRRQVYVLGFKLHRRVYYCVVVLKEVSTSDRELCSAPSRHLNVRL